MNRFYRNAISFLIILFILAGCYNNQNPVLNPDEQKIFNNELMKAVKDGNYSQSRKLIKKGADVNWQDYQGQTPLIIAIRMNKKTNLLQMLIDNGSDITILDYNGHSAWYFIKNNVHLLNTKVYEYIKEQSYSILKYENIDVNAFLEQLNRGAGVNAVNSYIQKGGDVNAIRKPAFNLITPIMVASGAARDPEVIRILLEAGALVNPIDDSGWTPLMAAAKSQENREIFQLLIDAGCDVNEKEKSTGATPLLIGAEKNNLTPEIINVLVTNGADVNIQDLKGRTALMFAAFNQSHSQIIELLLDASADVTIKDKEGLNAWDYLNNNRNLYELKNTKAYERLKILNENN